MQEETAAGLVVEGASKCRQLTSGCKFTLQRHFNAKGSYVVLAVDHDAQHAGRLSIRRGAAFHYENRFRCLPLEAPFRPPRETPRPVVHGTQTAVVVGPPGEEIFTDKYGRIKVQFHWDRQGKSDADSSCWVRVATAWAGPAVGHDPHPARRPGGASSPSRRATPIGRSRRLGVQRRHDAALRAAGQQDAERRQVAQQPQGDRREL